MTTESLRESLSRSGSNTSDVAMVEVNNNMMRLAFAMVDSAGGKRFCVIKSQRVTLCLPWLWEGYLIVHI